MTFGFDRLADYFTAVAALGAASDREKQRAIAALLGLADHGENVRPAASGADVPPARVVPKPPVPLPPSTVPSPGAAMPGDAPRRERASPRIAYTVTRRPAPRERPLWLEHVKALPPPRAEAATPPVPAPLLEQRWSRAILSTAMAQPAPTNAIDVEAIVDALSRGLPLRRVPLRVVPSLSRGVQLLIDRGPASAPFLRDQDRLVQQIQVVAGNDRVEVLRFDPSREFVAGKGARSRWNGYFTLTPPMPGMTVVLISDLGIAAVPHETGARPAEWREFLERIRARGNRVIAFVPFPRSRWPRLRRGVAHLIPWDRGTTVQLVRRAVGRWRVR